MYTGLVYQFGKLAAKMRVKKKALEMPKAHGDILP